MNEEDQKQAQQAERIAASKEWERRLEEGRAWAYFRAGVPLPPSETVRDPVEDMRSRCEAIARELRDRAAEGGCGWCMGDDIVSAIAALKPAVGAPT